MDNKTVLKALLLVSPIGWYAYFKYSTKFAKAIKKYLNIENAAYKRYKHNRAIKIQRLLDEEHGTDIAQRIEMITFM